MLQLKPLPTIGTVDHGWLKARLHFAIGGNGNPAHGPVGNLFVFNDDEIAAGAGFPLHPHADIEIISYVHDGVVTHEDSLGNKGYTNAGNVQVMSAGTGVRHAEYNEQNETARLFQIWLRPRTRGGLPQWGTRAFPRGRYSGSFVPLASGYGAPGAIAIRSDAEVYCASIPAGAKTTFAFEPDHSGYLVPASGKVRIGSTLVEAREGLIIRNEASITIEALESSELVLVITAEAV